MIPATYNFPKHKVGDYWPGLVIGPMTVNGAAPASAADSCRLQFRKGHEVVKFSDTPGEGEYPIVIDDAAHWQFTVDGLVLPLTAGKWSWEFELIDASGKPYTIYSGEITMVADLCYG